MPLYIKVSLKNLNLIKVNLIKILKIEISKILFLILHKMKFYNNHNNNNLQDLFIYNLYLLTTYKNLHYKL